MPNVLPTSDIETFKKQLDNPNTSFKNLNQKGELKKIKKHVVLSFLSDSTGCGHIRNIFPMTYLNSAFGKSGNFNLILSPLMIFQDDILVRTRSIYFQRTMDPRQISMIQRYVNLKKKFNFKMIWEIDDFIWKGDEEGESIPEYNFGGTNIKEDVQQASLDIANMMDMVTVSTDFLKEYMKYRGVKTEIVVLPNSVCQYFWGTQKKKPIKKNIDKPKIISTSSPTHYHNGKKLKGDFENAWCDWICKNVMDEKIEYYQMGGLPFFFEPLKNKPNFKVVPWVNSYQYHLPIKEIKPDFSIGPLVPNFFNYSKSHIKYEESCAYGAAFIGSIFESIKSPKCWSGSHAPSPYDVCFLKLQHDCTYKEIDNMIWEYCEPEKYNEIIKGQYEYLHKEQLWLESPGYVKRLSDIF